MWDCRLYRCIQYTDVYSMHTQVLQSFHLCKTCILPQTLENLVQRDLPKCESQAEALKKDMHKARATEQRWAMEQGRKLHIADVTDRPSKRLPRERKPFVNSKPWWGARFFQIWHSHTVTCVGAIIFPQQRKLMGSSAQISSGVCRCGSQEQVPEKGSGRFRRVPDGVGSGGGFRKVPESSGVKWCRFRRQVPEGSGRFRRVPEYAGIGSGGRVRKVPESSGVVCCLATLTGAAMWLLRSRG